MENENVNQQNDVVSDGAQTNDTSKETPIVFPDEKSFMSRVQRETKKQMVEFVKQLGFENDAQLKDVIQKQRDLEESQKTEYQKLQEQLQQKTEYINQVNQNLKMNEIKMEALNAGIKPERLNYALKLIDVNSIDFVDGAVDKNKVNEAISSLLNEFPELKGNQQKQKAGQDFSQAKTSDLLTVEMIKNMSIEETERRLPDILKFLEKK